MSFNEQQKWEEIIIQVNSKITIETIFLINQLNFFDDFALKRLNAMFDKLFALNEVVQVEYIGRNHEILFTKGNLWLLLRDNCLLFRFILFDFLLKLF